MAMTSYPKIVNQSLGKRESNTPVANCVRDVNPGLAKPSLKSNGGLAKPGLTSLTKQTTGDSHKLVRMVKVVGLPFKIKRIIKKFQKLIAVKPRVKQSDEANIVSG